MDQGMPPSTISKIWHKTRSVANKNWSHPKQVLTMNIFEALCEQHFEALLLTINRIIYLCILLAAHCIVTHHKKVGFINAIREKKSW
jgi:hypothetical protein